MAITKAQARSVRQPVLVGDYEVSAALDAGTTQTTVLFSSVAEKVTFQSDGDLAGNFEISVNGVNWSSGATFTANTIATYSTNLVRLIRVNRTGGSGRLHLIVR